MEDELTDLLDRVHRHLMLRNLPVAALLPVIRSLVHPILMIYWPRVGGRVSGRCCLGHCVDERSETFDLTKAMGSLA